MKDDEKSSSDWEHYEVVAVIIIAILILFSLGAFTIYAPVFDKVIHYFTSYSSIVSRVATDSSSVFGYLIGLSFPVSVMLLIGIIISVERLKKIRRKERATYDAPVVPAYDVTAKGDPELTNRWRKIVELGSSTNENDWRQAIIQADVILDEILDKMGYHGEGVGEKLKAVEKADFQTLDQAWEAHKVRNAIAHEGPDFMLSQHEVRRVINLFQQVFEEFFYI
jgi:hypothetical protein